MNRDTVLDSLSNADIDYREAGENEVCMSCPFCSDDSPKKKLYLNPSKGVFNCFRCGHGGSVFSLLRKLGIAFKQQPRVAQNDSIRTAIDGIYNTQPPVKGENLRLPDEYMPLWIPSKSVLAKKIVSSLIKKRRMTLEDIETFRVGFCATGKYAGHVIFPIQNIQGDICSYQTRRILSSTPKTVNPVSLGPKQLFNANRAKSATNILVVEGIFDCIHARKLAGYGLDIDAVALLGKTVATSQLVTMVSMQRWENVYVALDPDAYESAVEVSMSLHAKCKQVYILKLPQDPGKVDLPLILRAISKANPFSLSKYIIEKLIGGD
jgi:DNA primase